MRILLQHCCWCLALRALGSSPTLAGREWNIAREFLIFVTRKMILMILVMKRIIMVMLVMGMITIKVWILEFIQMWLSRFQHRWSDDWWECWLFSKTKSNILSLELINSTCMKSSSIFGSLRKSCPICKWFLPSNPPASSSNIGQKHIHGLLKLVANKPFTQTCSFSLFFLFPSFSNRKKINCFHKATSHGNFTSLF